MDIPVNEKTYKKIISLILKYDKVFSDEELEELNNNGLFDDHQGSYKILMRRRKKESKDSIDDTDFSIKCSMKDRWIPYFISFLKRMEADGDIGHSELLGFYADADGDFRLTFKFDSSEFNDDISIKKDPRHTTKSIDYYDAG